MDTKLIKQKILDLAIRGKLVPQNPADEPASILLERIKAEKAQLIKEGKIKKEKPLPPIEEVPFEIPESWEWCRLGEIILMLSGQDFPPNKYNDKNIGLPYLTGASNIENGKLLINRWTETPTVFTLKSDLLVVCKGSGVGKMTYCTIDSAHIARQFQAIRNQYGCCDLGFVKAFIEANLDTVITSATGLVPGISRDILLKIEFPLPPIAEQKRIVAEIDRWFKWIDELEKNQQDLHTAIQQAKSKILGLAIHGKLVPQESEWKEFTIEDINKYKSSSVNPLNYSGTIFELYSVPIFETGLPEYLKGEEIGSTKQSVEEGDVLLCKINPHLNRVWYVTHYKKDLQAIASSEWIIIRTDNIFYKYLVYYFQSQTFRDLLMSNVSGVGGSLMRAQPAFVKKYPIQVPTSIEEQKRIVSKIEELFTQLDKIEESLN